MSDSLEPISEPDQHLARQAATQPGSLLRLRDVQALNRSFRRMAEVQEALLDRLETLEGEKAAQSRLNGPLMAMGGVLLGCGLAILAFVLWQDKEVAPIMVQQEPAVVHVPAPEVTVQAPDNSELAAAIQAMNKNMADVFAAQKQDRRELGELTQKLLLSEEEKLRLMKEFALAEDQYQRDFLVSEDSKEPTTKLDLQMPDMATSLNPVAASSVSSAETWVAVVNGLLSVDGYSSLRLQRASRIAGEAALSGVTWMSWSSDGLVDTIIHAERLEFEMHRMTGNLVLRFFQGSRTARGLRTDLPMDGLRLDLESRNLDAWTEHFPELVDSVAALPVTVSAPVVMQEPTPEEIPPVIFEPSLGTAPMPVASSDNNPRIIQKALDDLISPRGSFSYYRLSALGAVSGNLLRLVQINWHDNSGRLVKTIEADTLEVILHRNSSVELLLRNGAFVNGGVKSPFSSDRFSLHLPRQDMNAWRASGVPFTEASR